MHLHFTVSTYIDGFHIVEVDGFDDITHSLFLVVSRYVNMGVPLLICSRFVHVTNRKMN